MAAARRLLKASSEGQSKVSLLTAGLVRECCRKFAKGDLSGDELLAAFAASEKLGQGKANELMAQFIDAWRSEFMAAKRLPDPVRAPFELGRSIGRGSQFLKEFGELDRGNLGFNLQAEQLISVWAAKAGNSVLRAGRETMELSTIRARTRFRRIAHAGACAFCAMLATRSDYYSAESALYVVGRQASGKRGFRLNRDSGLWGQAPVRYTGKTRGANRPIGSKYHDNCNCTVAEVTGDPEVDGIGDHGYGKLYGEAFEALDKAGKRRTLPEVMAEMRRRGQGIIRDAYVPEDQKRKPGPKTKTGGAGGGKKPPRKGAGPFKEMPEPPKDPKDGGDKGAWKAYWKERQDALPLDFKGDHVDPWEIETYERLLRGGQEVEPIPKKASAPTEDYVWLNKGRLKVEMKTISIAGTAGSKKSKAERACRRIEDAVHKAKNHKWNPIDKEYFLIDVGKDVFSKEEISILENYNRTRLNSQIKGLWVMQNDGELLKIELLR